MLLTVVLKLFFIDRKEFVIFQELTIACLYLCWIKPNFQAGRHFSEMVKLVFVLFSFSVFRFGGKSSKLNLPFPIPASCWISLDYQLFLKDQDIWMHSTGEKLILTKSKLSTDFKSCSEHKSWLKWVPQPKENLRLISVFSEKTSGRRTDRGM